MKLAALMKDTGLLTSLSEAMGNLEITQLTIDSRRAQRGGAFVCISGTKQDGHDFAKGALQDGAAVIVTQRDLGLPGQLLVSSTREAWAYMCANWFDRPSQKLKMIGVTGTNGKTTTTYLLKQILEACGHKVGLIGTIRNMIGDQELPSSQTTPDSYDLQSLLALMVAQGCDYAVMEVSSHALDQSRVAGCVFCAGVFTNLTQDHLDYHRTMEKYLEAKKRLFFQCDLGIINQDDAYAVRLTQGLPCRQITYAIDDRSADYGACDIQERADGVDFELVGTGVIGRVRLHTPGRFSVYNALAAAACALGLGLPLDTVIPALSQATGVKGRAEVVPTGRDFTVVIDYAHTPDGLLNICRTLKNCCTGRLITVFGCGGDRDKGKRPKMALAAAEFSDFLVITSDNPRTEPPMAIIEDILTGLEGKTTPHTVVENRTEAIVWAIRHAKPGDTVLLAGKGHETYQILGTGVIHLDEREIVAQALQDLS